MSGKTELQRPPGMSPWAICTDLTRELPAEMAWAGFRLAAWEVPTLGDPYFLYGPEGDILARWESPPTLGQVWDCYRGWRQQAA